MRREAGAVRPRGVPGFGREGSTEIPSARRPGCYPARVRRRQCRARRCGSGGIGRRGGLKSRCPRGLGGSSPPLPYQLDSRGRRTRNQAGRSRTPERGRHSMEARHRSSCACVRPKQHRPGRKTRRGEGCRPPRPTGATAQKQGPICSRPGSPSDPGQSVQVTLSMSRVRPSQAAARRTSSSSSGVGEARSSARLAVKYSGRKPALSSDFM